MAYMAFSGSFEHSLDGKGRVIIPASFREALGENFTITINPTRTAVAIYPKADWDGQLERLSHINPMDKIGLQYERYLMSVSFSGNSMDAQGRGGRAARRHCGYKRQAAGAVRDELHPDRKAEGREGRGRTGEGACAGVGA